MPIQTPQWTDFLICPICCNEFDGLHDPISLGCGHTFCKSCLSNLHRKQCPYDQTTITIDINELPTNYALLQLVSSTGFNQIEKNQVLLKLQRNIRFLPEEFHLYSKSLKHIENVALFLKPFSTAANSSGAVNVLSRPMQRKLVMLVNCQLLEEEGRLRALKATRSLGERTVTELIIQHQNPQQLSTNLWAAVRARGCQFLGPAMQEEVLKLVLLALEDGSALSRKVLVMFVVQRLEPHFPQASKTSIGHVVQLLYRASCFVVSKREGDSSLMKLREEFRTYDALRREHDAQIVEIATEAGLRIAPDQWSALLYGDTAHKSHMQSIIDKLQNPQSFVQSVQELVIALQRTGDPGNLCVMRPHLEYLADIDVNCDYGSRIWLAVFTALEAAVTVVSGLVNFIKTHGCRKTNADTSSNLTVHSSKYKISLCRDLTTNGICPRGINCTFAHSEEELIKYRSKHRKYQRKEGDSVVYSKFINNNNKPLSGQSNISGDNSNHISTKNMNTDETNCFFCSAHNYSPEYSDSTFVPFNETLYPRVMTSPSSVISNVHKISSSQYLVAMNQRKQQIISELQQVLSDVQNQHPGQFSVDVRRSSVLSNPNNSVPNSSYFMNTFLPTEEISTSNGNYNSSQTHVPLLSSLSLKSNTTFSNYGDVPDWNLVDLQSLTFNDTSNANNSASSKEPLYTSNDQDWNVNYSKLCRSCDAESSSFVGADSRDKNPDELTNEVHESLLLESAKLQDQLRGLKKQIMDITVKPYEEGIVSNLRALELRLECELAEEEKKLWPCSSE